MKLKEELKNKLISFLGADWFNLYENVFENYWGRITQEIKKEARPITPDLKNIFRCYKECSLNDLTTVVIELDPYPGLVNNKPIADGIAFSSINSQGKPPKSLKYIWSALNKEYNEWSRETDLTYIANQGVLLLNIFLTTIIGKAKAHENIWKEFTKDCLIQLSNNLTGINYVFLGEDAQKFIKYIDKDLNYIYSISHPASAAYKEGEWDDEGVFKQINNNLKSKNLEPIQWVKN